ncbi:MAG: hypothetical protein ACM3O4_01320 [Ignavibacteriales bacterium]
MKKNKKTVWYIILGIVVIILIVLGGMSLFKNDKLSCTSKAKDDYRTTNDTIEIYYQKNVVKKVVQTTKHVFNNKQSLNVFKEYLDESVESIKDTNHVSVSKNNDNLLYETTTKINVTKLDEKELINLHVSNNLEDLKSILTANGFECK